jgi:hypothetical protein
MRRAELRERQRVYGTWLPLFTGSFVALSKPARECVQS